MTMAKVRAKVAARKIQAIAGRKAEDRTVKALSLPTPRAAKELVEVEHKQHQVVSGVNISAFGRQKIRGKSIPLI
ncbi:MAG: hypothetical protein E7K90_03045 [Hafnia alvei]|uniref:hypothetical protein n=1 Tax=Hafnia alvei TaxID=569 RepID=UPI00290D45D9|nr:hypothetical protein [Hafnia alvei]MDU7480358.1 hypothetical protein [Hafnia alvei]